MTKSTIELKERYFGTDEHPYLTFEHKVEQYLGDGRVLLDAGCGRTAPVLTKYRGRAGRLIGVDLVDFPAPIEGVELINGDLASIPVPDGSVDVIMSRSVMEHVTAPLDVYREMKRVLRPGGYFVFLTGNFWDYAALIATLVPNRLHPWIVARTQGRAEADVFPTAYKTNTRSAVRKWADATGFEIVSFDYLGQDPTYFMFNGFLFTLTSGYDKLLRRFDAPHGLLGWMFVVLRKHEASTTGAP